MCKHVSSSHAVRRVDEAVSDSEVKFNDHTNIYWYICTHIQVYCGTFAIPMRVADAKMSHWSCTIPGLVSASGLVSWNCSNMKVGSPIPYNLFTHIRFHSANLQQYATVDDVGDINDRDLKRLGIRNLAHRQKMLNSLLGVRAKRRQSMNLEGSYNIAIPHKGRLLRVCIRFQPCAVHPVRYRVARVHAPWSGIRMPTRMIMKTMAALGQRWLPPKVARY